MTPKSIRGSTIAIIASAGMTHLAAASETSAKDGVMALAARRGHAPFQDVAAAGPIVEFMGHVADIC